MEPGMTTSADMPVAFVTGAAQGIGRATCAPSTSFVTGQSLFVDGGKSLGGLNI